MVVENLYKLQGFFMRGFFIIIKIEDFRINRHLVVWIQLWLLKNQQKQRSGVLLPRFNNSRPISCQGFL